jgi:hypothetical protein
VAENGEVKLFDQFPDRFLDRWRLHFGQRVESDVGVARMTEIEMATLFNDMQTAIIAQLSLYVSIMSGFLLMSFLAADRLTKPMLVVAISLFTWLWYVLLMLSYREMASFVGLMGEMRIFREEGKGLGWHGAAYTPAFLLDLIPPAWIAFQIVFYVAAVAFLLHCRSRNQSNPVNLTNSSR